jgi:15-cis-phytoene synthase
MSVGTYCGTRLLPRRKRRAIETAREETIDGAHMDIAAPAYESFEELLLHCRRTGGSLGRKCAAILGSRDPGAAAQLADDLGVAMALTNILRDLHEDAQRGRVYIPAQELVRYHLHDDGALDAQALLALAREGRTAEPSVIAGFEGGDVGQLYALMRFQALRARDWFHRGRPLVLLLDRRGAACVSALIDIHLSLLGQIEKRPDQALTARVWPSARRRAWVLARALLRPRRLPEQHPAERMQ